VQSVHESGDLHIIADVVILSVTLQGILDVLAAWLTYE
jgi:hypothetical protein